MSKKQRIGIYSGSFNPVHAGHISFALQALTVASLDKVYFMPERYRQGKIDMAHYAHRTAMIRQAIKPYRRLGLIDNSDVSSSVAKTLPKLSNMYYGSSLVFLMGSDILASLKDWPNAKLLLRSSELVVGIRLGDESKIEGWLNELPCPPKRLYSFASHAPDVTSTKIRNALRKEEEVPGTLSSVRRYNNRNWLYISLA